MSHKVSLPDGEWCSLREPEDVPERLRRPAYRAMMTSLYMLRKLPTTEVTDDDGNTKEIIVDADDEQMSALETKNDSIAVAMIESWSYVMPVTVESMLELSAKAHDVIQKAVAPLASRMFVDFSVDGATDPKADTGA